VSSRIYLQRMLREAAAAKKPTDRTFVEGFKLGWESIAGANVPSHASGVPTQNYRGGTAYIEGIRMGMEAANDMRPLKIKLGSKPQN
jgi:hypothetical protein